MKRFADLYLSLGAKKQGIPFLTPITGGRSMTLADYSDTTSAFDLQELPNDDLGPAALAR